MGTSTLDRTDLPDGEFFVKEDSGIKGVEVVDEEKGIIEALVSVTGIKDRVNDIIEPGAYKRTLEARTPKGLRDHDWKSLVSKALEVKELMPGDPGLPATLPNGDPWPSQAGALKVKAQYNLNTERGRDAYEDAKFFGSDQEWSIGYSVPKDGKSASKDKDGTRRIKSLDLFEFSQVLWGAMPYARTSSVKDATEDVEIEVKDELKNLKKPITMANGSYPISSVSDLEDAIKLNGHSKEYTKKQVRAHIRRCAAMLDASDKIPDSWDDEKDDSAAVETNDHEAEVQTVSGKVLQGTVEQIDLTELHAAWKTIGKFLHELKVIGDDVFLKVASEDIEGKTLDSAINVVEAFDDLFPDEAVKAEAVALATVYDFALGLDSKDAIDKAQAGFVPFLKRIEAKGADIAGIADALYHLSPEEENEEEDKSDDEVTETKTGVTISNDGNVVKMTRAEMMAALNYAPNVV